MKNKNIKYNLCFRTSPRASPIAGRARIAGRGDSGICGRDSQYSIYSLCSKLHDVLIVNYEFLKFKQAVRSRPN